MLVRRLARPMLSSIFVVSGYNSLRNPDRVAPTAAPLLDKLRSMLPEQAASLIPQDPATAVRINAGVQLGGGVLFATGRFPRFAALALAGSLAPTTVAGHAFWEEDDPEAKAQQRLQFLKNLSIMGGLLLAAVDTEGRPSLAWRGRAAVSSALPSGSDSSQTVSSLKETVGNVAEAAREHSSHLADVAKEQAPVIADAVREHTSTVAEAAKEQAPVIADAVREQGEKVGRRAAKQAKKAAKQARSQFA